MVGENGMNALYLNLELAAPAPPSCEETCDASADISEFLNELVLLDGPSPLLLFFNSSMGIGGRGVVVGDGVCSTGTAPIMYIICSFIGYEPIGIGAWGAIIIMCPGNC